MSLFFKGELLGELDFNFDGDADLPRLGSRLGMLLGFFEGKDGDSFNVGDNVDLVGFTVSFKVGEAGGRLAASSWNMIKKAKEINNKFRAVVAMAINSAKNRQQWWYLFELFERSCGESSTEIQIIPKHATVKKIQV